MIIRHEKHMGMELEILTHKSCSIQMGVGDDWATIFFMESTEQGNGHGQELLIEAKAYYEASGKTFGSSVALSAPMRHLLKKLNIPEYK